MQHDANNFDDNENNGQPRGQSMIEFALTIVIILVLLAGVVDLGRAIFTYLALRDAAQEGASFVSYDLKKLLNGAGNLDPNLINQILRPRVCGSSNLVSDLCSDITIEVNPDPSVPPLCNGNRMEVAVRMDSFELVTPFLGAIVGSQTIPIRASITDTILRPPCK